MVIAFVNTIPSWGGGEVWTSESALELKRRGHQIRVLVASGSDLEATAKGLGLATFGFDTRTAWHQLASIAALRRTVGPGSVDTWIANCLRDVWLINWVQFPLTLGPVIYRRGLSKPLRNQPLLRWRFRRVRHIVANSEATKRAVETSLPWMPAHSVTRLYNARHPDRFPGITRTDFRKEWGLDPQTYVVGIVGRLVTEKGHSTLLHAMRTVFSRFETVLLVIAGEGPLGDALRKEARALGIEDRCKFIGFTDEVGSLIQACDCVAVPSSGTQEGFGYVALEAQLGGRPVVASRDGGLEEVIDDRVSGFIVPAGNVEMLATQICELIQNRQMGQEMGRRGQVAATRKFSFATMCDRLEALLDDVSSRGRSGRGGSS